MLVGAIRSKGQGSRVVGSGRMKKKRKRISDGSHDANSHCPLKVAIMEALFVYCRMETQRRRGRDKVIKVQGDEAGWAGWRGERN